MNYSILKEFNVDLHIHTCLSPCADNDMLPYEIIKEAKKKNLGIIGITDHNSSDNAFAVKKAGEKEGIYVVLGMEVTTSEEIHILAFFENEKILQKFQNFIYQNLNGENDEEMFGLQIIADINNEIIGMNKKLLIGATEVSMDKIINTIHSFNGIAIASHIDKERFSIISQLGYIPENIKLDGIEISDIKQLEKIKTGNFTVCVFSDAHCINDIGRNYTKFLMKKCSFKEIKMALRNKNKRKVIL